MKKNERICNMVKILSNAPNRTYSLNYFSNKFGVAKSSVSEDIFTVKTALEKEGLGKVITMAGAAGGVKYIPFISDKETQEVLRDLCQRLNNESRILTGGFLYTSDIMFNSGISKKIGEIFARVFQDTHADYIVTVETKGIPVAFMTAEALNLPLVVIRRESKLSEGSTLSINYISGSSNRIQKMTVAKRAIQPSSKVLIIDDFMRGGGTIRGITELMEECDSKVVGTGIVIASETPTEKSIDTYVPLIHLGNVDKNTGIEIRRNSRIFE